MKPCFSIWLQFKKANGTPIERHVYTDLNLLGLVERMISKRPRSFYGAHDKYLLRDGRKGSGKWELIGNQVSCWKLEHVLSFYKNKKMQI